LVIVKENPLEDIKNIREVEWTIVDGRIYSLETLLSENFENLANLLINGQPVLTTDNRKSVKQIY